MMANHDPAEQYTNTFVELNILEAAMCNDIPAVRSLLARTTAKERRYLIKAFNLTVDEMNNVAPEVL